MEFPADLKYTENDEWIKVEGTQGTVGITDWAQDQLSDIVYVEIIADLGETIPKGETFASVESVKAAADVYMPVTGKLVEGNEALADTPEMVNTDPYGAAWMAKIEIADPSELEGLLDAAAYQKHCEERES
ncbi:MAG: glycine cleavage system protein GcvH [Anaerolineales bacterium]|jgi:glycine cleavage system H protein